MIFDFLWKGIKFVTGFHLINYKLQAGHSETRVEQGASIPPEIAPLMREAGGAGQYMTRQASPILAALMGQQFPQRIPSLSPLEGYAGRIISQQLGASPFIRDAGLAQLGALTSGAIRREPEYRRGIGQLGALAGGSIRSQPEYRRGFSELSNLMRTGIRQEPEYGTGIRQLGSLMRGSIRGEPEYQRGFSELGSLLSGSIRREPEYGAGIGQLGSLVSTGMRREPEYGAGLGQLGALVGGRIGESPVTQQAIAALRAPLEAQFFETTLPTIQNQMSLAGLGRSGALGDEIRKAALSTAGVFQKGITPLLQQEISMRERAVPQLLSLAREQTGFQERAVPQLLSLAREQVGRQERAIPMMFGLAEAQAGRQERGIAELLGLAEGQAARRERGATQMLGLSEAQAGRQERAASQMLNLAESQMARRERAIPTLLTLAQQGIQNALGFGGMERGIEEARGQATLQDLLRRQGLAERSVFGPMQTLLPASIGSGPQVQTGKNYAPFLLGGTK